MVWFDVKCKNCSNITKQRRNPKAILKTGEPKFCNRECYTNYLREHPISRERAIDMRKSRKITSGWKRPDMAGKNNFFYKRGYWITSDGYICIKNNGREILLHRVVMENNIGRKLLKSEHVHHINEDKQDNRIENLQVLSNSEHRKLHKLPTDSSGRFVSLVLKE